MYWQQLSVTTTERAAPVVSELFSSLGAVSVTYQDAADQPIYEPKPGETRVWDRTIVTGLFDAHTDLAKVRGFIDVQLGELVGGWTQHDLEDEVWERAWMAHFRPMRFGTALWVCPTGQEPPEKDGVVVTLDPGLAFGTGTHPTTSLCLEWLAENDVRDASVIDYGCGSGILGIAACLLGAKETYAVDIDPQAIAATRENAKKNGVAKNVHCFEPDQLPPLEADVLLANILANPLAHLANTLTAHVKVGGTVILSGILVDQIATVETAYQTHFDLSPPTIKENWVRLDGRRTN